MFIGQPVVQSAINRQATDAGIKNADWKLLRQGQPRIYHAAVMLRKASAAHPAYEYAANGYNEQPGEPKYDGMAP
jgi:hypothetical protein